MADEQEDARLLFAELGGGAKTITVAEFKKGLMSMLDNSEVLAKSMNAIVSIIDSDDSGTITEQEFIKSAKLFMAIADSKTPYEDPDLFFDILDADGSGTLSANEMNRLFTALLPSGTDRAMVEEAITKELLSAASAGAGGAGKTEITRAEMRAMVGKLRDLFLREG